MKGFDDHLDNYGDPDPGDEEGESDADWAARLEREVEEARQDDDGITTDDFDNWPAEREFPS